MIETKINLRIILLISLCTAGLISILGINSDLSLGDETFHFRLAQDIFRDNRVPLYDRLTNLSEIGKTLYTLPVLWHILLVFTWKLTGQASQGAAQFYHLIFYFILIASVYYFTEKFYGKIIAFYAFLITLSVPIIICLSMILQVDIAVMAFTTLAMFMLIEKRFFTAGVLLGIAFLIKRNSYFFVPGFILTILTLYNDNLKQKSANLIKFALPVSLFFTADFLYIFSRFYDPGVFFSFKSASLQPLNPEYGYFNTINNNAGFRYFFYDIGNITLYPLNVIFFLGLVLTAGLIVYFLQRTDKKKELFFLPPVLIYIVLFLVFFRQNPSVRYLLPIIPFLAVLSAKAYANIKKSWVKNTVIAGVILQFAVTNAYVFSHRQISLQEKEAHEYIKNNTPLNSRIMCSENKLALYTQRITFWVSYCSLVETAYLFWRANEQQAKEILNRYKIGYILIEKNRIYNDSVYRHLGGYPESFLTKIKTWKSFKKVFENRSTIIYKYGIA